MHILHTHIKLTGLFLLSCLLTPATTQSAPFSQTLNLVPKDSILILSIDGKKIISKSGILKNPRWLPLLNRLENNGSPIRKWLSDSNNSAIEWDEPLQFFLRLIEGEQPQPQFGAIAKIKSSKQADRTLADLGNLLGLRPSINNPNVYQRATQPFAIGRQGDYFFLLGTLFFQQPTELSSIGDEIAPFVASLSANEKPRIMPSSLAKHAQHSADLSLYLEGSGTGRLFETLKGNTLFEGMLPLFDPLLQDSFGILLNSLPGSLQIQAHNYVAMERKTRTSVEPLKMVDQLPGDSPLVARFSFPEEDFQGFLSDGVDSVLRFLSANKLGADTDLPGFDLSARELLKFPSGDFVLAGGNYRNELVSLPTGQSIATLTPIWATGIKISHPLALRELIAGMSAGMGLSSFLNSQQLRMNHFEESAWITSPEYSREIKLGNPIKPLSFDRRKLLNNHNFALDFNPAAAARSLRQSGGLSFDQLKRIRWLDECKNLSIRMDKHGVLFGKLILSQSDQQGWHVLADRLGQEWIDLINARLFLGIARDDLNEVMESVAMGALINANDRFGHSPLHYAAYRGNAYIVDYLLRHGGNPNTRGNHLSTPLHSAAWGKNQKVVELLLEDGAEVDAQTDEHETPIMTATLRGQVETVETLLALSADPHAVDKYGSNLMDLAGASGNKKLVQLFKKLGVKVSYPLHLAAGTGDFASIKSLLEDGRSINEQDSFGATPLLVATVAGREDMVIYLLEHSADPQIEAKDGYSLLHGAAFSGKKSLVRMMLAHGLKINQRYGPDQITPADVGEEGSEGLLYLRSMGGRSAWELGPAE